jgi:hypothetical protein
VRLIPGVLAGRRSTRVTTSAASVITSGRIGRDDVESPPADR